ncbi:phosphoribosylglycinamide formyltransferase [bacterium]|nr:phosphoribosylglycinamide formyltransferase [bacterium]
MIRLGVLGSGHGTNFEEIAQCIMDGRIKGAEIAVVISDVEDAPILRKAARMGLQAVYLPADDYKTKLEGPQEDEYIRVLKANKVDYVILAGFMRMIKANFLKAFRMKVVNIHPALLPAFPGLESWKQALDYGAKLAGCTIHFVDAGMDSGPIIAQAAVHVMSDDTPETLHARIQEQEHVWFPKVINWLAAGAVKVRGRKVMIKA